MTRLALLPVALLATDCGAPTSPSHAATNLTTGRYLMSFRGANYVPVGGGLVVQGCVGTLERGFVFPYAAAQLDLTSTSSGWHGRPRSDADGAFEFDFTLGTGATGSPFESAVTAKATGTMTSVSSLPPEPLFATRILFGDGATLTGTVSRDHGSGVVSSAVSFANSAGGTVQCNPGTVTWFMYKVPS